MLRLGVLSAVSLLAGVMPAFPQDIKPEVLLLARVKAHLRDSLAQLPDYTCLETIRRYRSVHGGAFRPLDTLQLEVLFNGTRELYASPGRGEFGDEHPTKLISEGLIGEGHFALLLKAIFLDGGAVITYGGEEQTPGRRQCRFDFRVSPLVSGRRIRSNEVTAIVGMRGSAWVDPDGLDVIRIENYADEIPPDLRVLEQSDIVRWARTRMGEKDVMLPQSAELTMRSTSGVENHDAIEFTQCRAFRAESAMSFALPEGYILLSERNLPAGVQVGVSLSSAVTEETAVGTAIMGHVISGGLLRRKRVIPSGAVLRGRVRRLEPSRTSSGYYEISIEFTELDIDGEVAPFYAELIGADSLPGIERLLRKADLSGVGSFLVRGEPHLPAGFKTVWKTLSP